MTIHERNRLIVKDYVKIRCPMKVLAVKYNVHVSTISRACRNDYSKKDRVLFNPDILEALKTERSNVKVAVMFGVSVEVIQQFRCRYKEKLQ